MIEVYVKKQADYGFREGESLEMFSCALHQAVEDKYRVRGTREMDWENGISAYARAIEPGRVIFERYGRGATAQGIKGLWSVTYNRNPQTYEFTFGEPERVIESVAYTPIKKSADYGIVKFVGKWAGLPIKE
jgi:hypothetical protein